MVVGLAICRGQNLSGSFYWAHTNVKCTAIEYKIPINPKVEDKVCPELEDIFIDLV